MRLPQWLKGILVTALLGSVAWAITDRMTIGERLSAVEQYIKDSIGRLDRIEHKLDQVIKENK
jgi:hypothetical protein